MQILLVGGGGREHALAWKLAQSKQVVQVHVAPGNPGTAVEPKTSNVAIAVTDIAALLNYAREKQIDLTIVGPEAPLVAGIVDQFQAAGLTIFGPSQQAAQLEGSKTFCKDFLRRHNIPTASYQSFTAIAPAISYIQQHGAPIVVKADGLAAGKGVIIAQTVDQAIAAVKDMLAGNAFGEAGHRVVIEEFLAGEEASFIVMTDGQAIVPMASSQDHKARDNGDTGPNTGGMGAYSPAPLVTDAIHQKILQQVIIPTIAGMAADGINYTGFLYAGLMITPEQDIRVLEFNCRFGDPETQPIMLRLQSDFADLCLAGATGQLQGKKAVWSAEAALGVVMAAGGYPNAYDKGKIITGLTAVPDNMAKVFHAGTKQNPDGAIVTNGGRVLCVTALGKDIQTAQQQAYAAVRQIHWDKVYYRTDIGFKAIARKQ